MWQSNEISTVAFSTACTCTAASWSTGIQVCVSRPTVTEVWANSVITVSPWRAVCLIQKTLIWIYEWQETNHISSQHVKSCGNISNIKLHITCCHSLTSIHYLKISPERVPAMFILLLSTTYMELFWRDPIRALDTLDMFKLLPGWNIMEKLTIMLPDERDVIWMMTCPELTSSWISGDKDKRIWRHI